MKQTKPKPPEHDFIIVPQSEELCEQVFFDGVSGTMMGAANCKIAFHQVIGMDSETSQEKRKISLTVIMPTSALVDFCLNTLNSIQENSELLKNALSEHEEKIFSCLQKTKQE